MRKRAIDCLCGVAAAWEMLVDVPFPEKLRGLCRGRRPSGLGIAAGFVLVGLLAGIILALAGWILNLSRVNRYAASGIFALAAVAVCNGKDSFRGLKLLVSALSGLFSGRTWRDSLTGASADDGSFDKTGGCIAALTILGAELFSFALLFGGGASLWSVAVLTGGCTAQMFFAALPGANGSPYLALLPADRRKMWILPALVTLWMILRFPVAGIASSVIAGGLCAFIHRDFTLTKTPIAPDAITLAGKLAELVLLLCGLLFIL